ncbi:MAG: histidine kinase [Candidatus Cyclobacteriaceae bacterium M2_1C_046]
MYKNFFINKISFRLLIPPVIGIFAYLLILMLINNISYIPELFKGQEVYFCIGLAYLLSESQRLLIRYFHRRSTTISTFYIVLQLISGTFLSIALTTAAISLYFELALNFSVSETQLIVFNCVYGILALLYHLLFLGNFYYYQQNTEQLMYEEQLKEDLNIEIKSFHQKVNPQLLYHSLETLITLAHKDVNEAEDFIDHLSAIYRHILSSRNKELVTLEQELKATQHIIYLLNYEYNNHIFFTTDFSTGTDRIMILPGTLTLLVEYVVRNNIITPLSPLRIELYDEQNDDYLIIKNNLNERLQPNLNFEHIFKSLQRSYNFYSEKPIISVKAHTDNYLKLPLLKVPENKETILL